MGSEMCIRDRIILTHRKSGRLAHPLNGRQQQPDQDANDCDHNQQLYQRESSAFEFLVWELHVNFADLTSMRPNLLRGQPRSLMGIIISLRPCSSLAEQRSTSKSGRYSDSRLTGPAFSPFVVRSGQWRSDSKRFEIFSKLVESDFIDYSGGAVWDSHPIPSNRSRTSDRSPVLWKPRS